MPVPHKADSRRARDTDHLVPHANRLLGTALKGAWVMTKFIAGVVIRIPGWFVRAARRHEAGRRGD